MKIIRLVFSRLYGHFSENKLIAIIYIFGFLFSVLSFIFIYNNFMPNVTRLAKDDPSDHAYLFSFSTKVKDISELKELIKDYDTDFVEYTSAIFEMEEIEPGVWYSSISDDTPTAISYITAYQDDNVVSTLSRGRITFTEEEKSGNSYVAIFPANNPELDDSSEYTYEGNTYQAIGWHIGNDTMIIPEALFEKEGFGVSSIYIYTSKILSASKQKELVETICDKYNMKIYNSPASLDDTYKENTKPIILMLTAAFLVMVFVFGYLLRYLVRAGKGEMVIYRLTGAGNGEMLMLTLLESLIANIILVAVAIVIHAALFDLFFCRLNFYNVRLELSDYLIIMGITTVFSFMALLPHVIQSVRTTLISSRNQI